jgi:hypothetical protein
MHPDPRLFMNMVQILLKSGILESSDFGRILEFELRPLPPRYYLGGVRSKDISYNVTFNIFIAFK